MTVCIVVFGAAVRPDGTPSGSLRRRCEQAAAQARRLGQAWVLATGGVGRHGPAEALLMRDILIGDGVPADRILIEPCARDTLESVRLCTRLLRERPEVERLLVCSSGYHNPRCVLLFRIAGFACTSEPTPSDRPHLGTFKWTRYVLKEFVVTPWDALVLLTLKMAGRI